MRAVRSLRVRCPGPVHCSKKAPLFVKNGVLKGGKVDQEDVRRRKVGCYILVSSTVIGLTQHKSVR